MPASQFSSTLKEGDILKAILQYLKIRGYVCKRNNAGRMFGKHKGKNWVIRIGEIGWPDIEGIAKDGRYFGIEVKRPDGILSDNQKDVGERIVKTNGIWFVARSVDDVIARGF